MQAIWKKHTQKKAPQSSLTTTLRDLIYQLSLSSELTVALLENKQGSQATVYTRETHEGKTQ